jgi:hypothetical protein
MSIWQAEWQEKIQSQADIIAQQSRRIESLVTGGDNYAYGSFSPAGDGQSFNLVLVNAGSFPLYDIVLQIFDVTASGSASVQTSRGGLLAFRQTISIGNIAPDAALVSGVMLTMPTGGSRQDYNLFSAAGTVSGISSSAFET